MFTFDSDDGVKIHVREWKPDTPPRAAVQIAHGMGEHAGLPLVLLGHSLGSFAAQHYALKHAYLIDALVLAGTTAVDVMLAAQAQAAAAGVDPLLALNEGFHPLRTPFDWLSRDARSVDAYLAQPQGIPVALPVRVLVGDRDPLNANLSLSDLLVDRYRAAGLWNVSYRTYAEARHELFHETNAQEVVTDLLSWLNHVVPTR